MSGVAKQAMNSTPINYDGIAEIYDLYVTADYDIPFFLQETVNVAGQVVELTAGTGRLSLPLAQAGVRLTCVDASQGMLNVLSRKLKDRGLSVELKRADLCQLELPTRFQLALLPFQSFMEIVGEPRQRQALSSVAACLVPGRRFICTMHNPSVRRLQVDNTLRIVGRFPTRDGSLVVSGFETGGHPVVHRLQFFEFFDSDGNLRSKKVLPMEFEFITLEHLPREEHAVIFSRIATWLKPGGYLLLGTEAAESAGRVGMWLGVPMFFSSYDPATVQHLISAAGMMIQESAIERQREQDHEIAYLWILARKA